MGDTFEDMGTEIEQKDNETNFLAVKTGTSNEDVTKQIEQVYSTKTLNKTDRVTKRLTENFEKHWWIEKFRKKKFI